jgi:hypothetical protein
MKRTRINEGLINKFIDSFFDGLKTGAVNKALVQAKKSKIPTPVVDKMEEIDRMAKELELLLKQMQS